MTFLSSLNRPTRSRINGARRCRNRRAATAVEMAVVFPIFCLLVIGSVEITRLFLAYNAAEVAALKAARTMAIPSGNHDKAIAVAEDYLRGLKYPKGSFQVSAKTSKTETDAERVTIEVAIKAAAQGHTVHASVSRTRE